MVLFAKRTGAKRSDYFLLQIKGELKKWHTAILL